MSDYKIFRLPEYSLLRSLTEDERKLIVAAVDEEFVYEGERAILLKAGKGYDS